MRKILISFWVLVVSVAGLFPSQDLKAESKSRGENLVYSIRSDKAAYRFGEDIKFFLTLTNKGNSEAVLNFPTGCQTAYTINQGLQELYDSNPNNNCAGVFTKLVVPAGASYTWTFVHKVDQYALTPGKYTITGRVVGYGSAATTLTVRSIKRFEFYPIITNSHLLGKVSEPYRAIFKVIGPEAPYQWSLVGGHLPPGLELGPAPMPSVPCPIDRPYCHHHSASVDGTPTQAGVYTFILQATDGRQHWARNSFTIVITD